MNGSHTLWYDVGNDHWGFATRIGGSITKVTGGSPKTGRWTRLRVSYNGKTLKLFVDDTEADSTDASGRFETESDIQIGSDNGDHNYWDGRIDEVKIYSHALWQARRPSTPTNGDDVTNIEYANQGLAFAPNEQSYSPASEFIFPSVIETSKLTDPLGKYHLYCAPHGISETKDGETVGVALFYSDTLGDGSWTEYADNPIVDPSNYDASHISSPHAVYLDEYDELFLYWHGPNSETRWSTSMNGVDFSYGGVAVDTSMYTGSSETSYARVYDYAIPNRNNRYTMFFMDNQSGTRHIRLATSNDAKNWTVDPDEVITPQYEHNGNVSGPFFFRYDEMYCLAFHASDGNQWVAKVGRNVDMEDHLGMFNQATSGEPDNRRCASPFLVRDGNGQPWVYYESDDRLDAAIAVEKLTNEADAANLDLFDLD